MENPIQQFCPVCKSQVGVFRVVDLYFAFQGHKPEILSGFSLSKTKKTDLLKLFSPPLVERQPIWRILHPDILFGSVGFALVVMTLFLFVDNKPWINNLYLLGILSVTYFLLRKRFVRSFTNNQLMRENLRIKAVKKADIWSSAYYCEQDDIVFIPEGNKTYSPSEFSEQFLLK